MNQVVARQDEQDTSAVPSVERAPASMLALAIERGMSPEVIGQLITHQERIDAMRARKAFDEALAAAKAEIPVIRKNRQVGFESRKPGAARTDYKHEDLAEIARTVDPILTKYGLSYRFRTDAKPNEPVTVTCIIAHRDGHSEENSLSAGRDDSGNKNSIQQIGSTITYLQRYTLKAALGLAASADDDGAQADDEAGAIAEEQVGILRAAIVETGADLPKFLKYFKIEKIEELPAANFDRAKQMLMQRAAKGAE
jgi:hypothetical protein